MLNQCITEIIVIPRYLWYIVHRIQQSICSIICRQCCAQVARCTFQKCAITLQDWRLMQQRFNRKSHNSASCGKLSFIVITNHRDDTASCVSVKVAKTPLKLSTMYHFPLVFSYPVINNY